MNSKLWIFDVDGTLVDSLKYSYEIDKGLVQRYGGSIPDLDSYREAIQMGNWDKFYEGFGIQDPEKRKNLLERYYDEASKVPLQPLPYAHELLKYLRRKRTTIAIVSINKSLEKVIDKLRKTDLEKYFDRENIQFAESKKTGCIRKQCEKTKVSYKEAIFVGDTAKDVIEAREAGVKTAAIIGESSYHPEKMIVDSRPDYLFKDLKEIFTSVVACRDTIDDHVWL